MNFTMQFASNADDESTQYVEILHNVFEHIIEDHNLNGYELGAVSKYARCLCDWMDDEASKRKDLW